MISESRRSSTILPVSVMVLGALAVGAGAAAMGPLASAAVAPLFGLLCLWQPLAGAVGLIAACALDRFAIGVAGPNVRFDELVGLVLAAALVVRAILAPYRPRLPHVARTRLRFPLLLPLLAYLGTNLLSTLLSSDPLRGLNLDAITIVLIVLYLALMGVIRAPQQLNWLVAAWLIVAGLEAVIGVGAFALYSATHNAVFGVQFEPDTGAPKVYGTMYEANIFGSYMSATFLLALALLTEESIREKRWLYLSCGLSVLGLLLSVTRSAWGGAGLSVVVLLVLLQQGRGGRRARAIGRIVLGVIVALVVVGVGLTLAPPSISGVLGQRIIGLLNFSSGSGYGRVQLYNVALSEWQSQPLFGLGPGSFTYRLPGDNTPGPAWLPNLTLQALHDTGVLGLLAMLWLFVAFYVETIRALRRSLPGRTRATLAGLIAAVTSLLISFQLTPGFLLGYSWVLIALAVAAAEVVGRNTTPAAAILAGRGRQQR